MGGETLFQKSGETGETLSHETETYRVRPGAPGTKIVYYQKSFKSDLNHKWYGVIKLVVKWD